MGTEKQLDARIDTMRTHFLVPPSPEGALAEFDASIASLLPEYVDVASGFRYSLTSTLSTIGMPFTLAFTSVENGHFQRIYTAERIRARSINESALVPGEELEAVRDREAGVSANSRMQEFVQSEVGQNRLIADTCEFLLASLKHGLEAAAHELLQQGLVLLWSAFEVLCRDTFETMLNQSPERVRDLISHPTTRRRFEAEKLPLDVLARHGFNVSATLGTVLVRQQDLSDLPTIKTVYAVLFPGDHGLSQALAERQLWVLYQRRHLIVHRRGTVDQDYLDATGEDHPIGTQLTLAPKDFEDAMRVVVSGATALARSLSAGGKD